MKIGRMSQKEAFYVQSKARISCQKVYDEGAFCIVVDLENCHDMLH